ncbi:TIGR03016 family PEP-CTERM system-associated outer membrane protein, partial [bacterium]
MESTMEKRGSFIFLREVVALLVLMMVCTPLSAYAGELSFHPYIAISEEFTDNVYESRDEKQSDFVTRFLPGMTFKYVAPLWDWDLAYNLDYRLYARNSRSDETTHNLAAKGHVKLIDERLFLDISDTFKRVSLDVSRDYTQEGLYSNQSDSNILTVSPYAIFRPGGQTTIKTGYRYS